MTWKPTACPEFERSVAAWLEGSLPAGEREAVERHLIGCVECRAFAESFRHLDVALVRAVQAPVLSADFTARVRRRIEAEPAAVLVANRQELKRRFQAEYEAGLARMQRRFRSFGAVLDVIASGFLLAGAATVVVMNAPKALQFLPASLRTPPDRTLVVGALVGAVFLLAGGIAAWRSRGRVGSWV